MRVPEDLLNATVFLGGRDGQGQLHYRATALCLSMPAPKKWRTLFPCLVTAKHNIVKAMASYGNVFIRANTSDGDSIDIEITEPWFCSDTADIAAVPFPGIFQHKPNTLPLPASWIVTDESIASYGIGPGEELAVMGLFSNHVGRERNLPIVRSGNIAAMPSEPLTDIHTGETYDAYLAEVRSIGGLSGSPVFVVLNPATRLLPGDTEFEVPGKAFFLLGLIRGHWNTDAEDDFYEDYLDPPEKELLNSGIAIVTPLSEVLPLFETKPFADYREVMEKKVAEDPNQVEDWEAEGSDNFGQFRELTRKLLRVPKKELDEKLKEKD